MELFNLFCKVVGTLTFIMALFDGYKERYSKATHEILIALALFY